MSEYATGTIDHALLRNAFGRAVEGIKAEIVTEQAKEAEENAAFRAGKMAGFLWWKHPMTETEAHYKLYGEYEDKESERMQSRLRRIETLQKTFESSSIRSITLTEYDLRLIRKYL